jgi:hypothetical protein
LLPRYCTGFCRGKAPEVAIFKILILLCWLQEALSKKGVKKFVGSSGGNAGVAMAVAAKGEQGNCRELICRCSK